MSELESYLQEQSSEGTHQSSGSFMISLEKARKKRAAYALNRPEFWVLRLLQGLARLGANQVDIVQDKATFTVRANFTQALCSEQSLLELFRISQPEDARLGIQDAIWGAVGKGLKVALKWREREMVHGFHITKTDVKVLSNEDDLGRWNLIFQVVPAVKASLLRKLFRTVNYSGEFHAITTRALLAPFALTLDNRPYSLDPSEFVGKAMNWELRTHRATEGPRLNGYLGSQLGKSISKPEQTQLDSSFLLLARWSPLNPKPLTIHWVKDGIQLKSQAEGSDLSPLCLDLYLSADGLNTDLSRLELIEDEVLTERIESFKLQASFSLTTYPLLWQDPEILPNSKQVQAEVRSFCEKNFQAASVARRNLQGFQNAPKLTRSYNEQAKQENLSRSLSYQRQLQEYHQASEQWEKRNKPSLAQLQAEDQALFSRNIRLGDSKGSWARMDESLVASSIDRVTHNQAMAAMAPPVHPILRLLDKKYLLGDIYRKLPGASPLPPPSDELLSTLSYRKRQTKSGRWDHR